MSISFHPTVTVRDNGDGTADVEFDWEGSINPKHAAGDVENGSRLSDAIDKWEGHGRPDHFTLIIPKDKRQLVPPPAPPK